MVIGEYLLEVSFVVVSFYFVVLPVTTLVHEVGHALAGLSVSERSVIVSVGDDLNVSVSLGRLVLLLSPSRGYRGVCHHNAAISELSQWQRVLFFISGPVASLGLLTMLIWLRTLELHSFLQTLLSVSIVYTSIIVLVTLLPINIEDGEWLTLYGVQDAYLSDGYRALLAIMNPSRRTSRRDQ